MKKFNIEILPIIGMSPGNSYFQPEIITILIQEILNKYGYAVIVVPDIPAISTYEAMGYSLSKARTKAVSRGNNLKNRTHRSLEQCAVPDELVYILNWKEDIQAHPLYLESYNKIIKLFENNNKFRNEILDTTRAVLKGSGKEIIDMEKSLLKGSEYILSEFAFLEICPELFSSNETRFIYHRDWPAYQNYISGKFDDVQKGYLSFEKLILT